MAAKNVQEEIAEKLLEPVRVENVAKFLTPMVKFFVEEVDHKSSPDFREILDRHPRIIHLGNHGTMLSPYILSGAIATLMRDNGGGERTPFGVIHRRLFKLPFVKAYFRKNFNSQKPYRFEEVLRELQEGAFTDFVVFPEGANENIGDVYKLSPFKSHRYLELAIRAEAPILIHTHRGTEEWASTIRLDQIAMMALERFLPSYHERIAPTRMLNFQGIPTRIKKLRVNSLLYLPRLKAHELSEDVEARKAQIKAESQQIAEIMSKQLTKMDLASVDD